MMIKKLKSWLPLLIFIIVAVLLWNGLYQNPHVIASPLIGKPMPNFSAPTLEHPQQTLTNESLKGRVTVLSVFATWCVSCQVEHPILMDVKTTQKINLIGLNYKDQRSSAVAWLENHGNPYSKVIYDPSGQIGIDFGVYGVPETFIIDKQGIVRDKIAGPISAEQWRDKLIPEIRQLERS